MTGASKALRATARNYLKSQMASAESAKSVEATPATPTIQPEPQETVVSQNGGTSHEAVIDASSGEKERETAQTGTEGQSMQSEDVVQSIEVGNLFTGIGNVADQVQVPRQSSRRDTLDSASGNEDDDIEINVGPDYDFADLPAKGDATAEEEDQWSGEQQPNPEKSRKNSTLPTNQQRSQSQIQNQMQPTQSDSSQMNSFSSFDGNSGNMSNDQMMNMMQNMSMGMNMPNPQSMMMSKSAYCHCLV